MLHVKFEVLSSHVTAFFQLSSLCKFFYIIKVLPITSRRFVVFLSTLNVCVFTSCFMSSFNRLLFSPTVQSLALKWVEVKLLEVFIFII